MNKLFKKAKGFIAVHIAKVGTVAESYQSWLVYVIKGLNNEQNY